MWIIPRLSVIQHSLYLGVVEKSPPPLLTVWKDGVKKP